MEHRQDRKRCELCHSPAAVHCPADEANLCWHCDEHVHAANFLVARHWRVLICSSCGALSESGTSGSRIKPKLPCCRSCLVGLACTGEFDREDDGSKVAVSPIRDNSVVSSRESESSRSSRGLSVKRSRNAWEQAGSARWNCNSTRSRRREPKLASTVETGDETSCESNLLHLSSSTTAASSDCSISLDLAGGSEEARVCVCSASASPSDGSLFEDRWHRRKSLRCAAR